MLHITVQKGENVRQISLNEPCTVKEMLAQCGISFSHPCGGRGLCGACRIEAGGNLSEMTPRERQLGFRLSCQTVLLGDAVITLPDDSGMRIEGAEDSIPPCDADVCCAADIGTTTVAVNLYDGKTGALIGQKSRLNPQSDAASDVIGRIGAAMNGQGERLQRQISGCLLDLMGDRRIDRLVITGNTAMLYLLTGKNPASLAAAPFLADCLFDETVDFHGMKAYLPPCMHAFVGADITCAVLKSGMCNAPDTALLCDIGTNGELALWKGGRLYVTSTAAGPAFEGVGLSCGCQSVPGAVDRVRVVDGKLSLHTIGNLPPVGFCGSGVIDLCAGLLQLGIIDETGAMEAEKYAVTDSLFVPRKDIRSIQLAKAALCAGILTLLEETNTNVRDVTAFYVAGGFGTHLNFDSAAGIGLFPEELGSKLKVLGNAALAGAAGLMDEQNRALCRDIARKACHVTLGGSARFNENYMDCMLFPEA